MTLVTYDFTAIYRSNKTYIKYRTINMHMYFVDVFVLFHHYIFLYSFTLFSYYVRVSHFLATLNVSIMLYIYFYSGVQIQRAAIGSYI
jgi:hypothetical protein